MKVSQYYLQNKEEIKFGAAFIGIVVTGLLLSEMLTRALAGSPLRTTLARLFMPFGLDAASPSFVLLGVYLTGLVLLMIDQTKRPQSVFLLAVTVIGLTAVGLNGHLIPYFGAGDLALFLLGVAVAVLYVGPESISQVRVSDPNNANSSLLDRPGSGQLEFRSAERLLYALLGFLVLLALFEAHTQYEPLVNRNLFPNLDAITSLQLTGTEGEQLAIDFGASGIFLVMLYLFLGYDAEKTFFVVGPKRSGKTHAVIALHEEAEEHGYSPRNESQDLLTLENNLVETNEWAPPTDNTIQDLSFSFTSKGVFRKNVRLEARDYPGELLRAILPATRYHTDSKEDLISEYPNVESKAQWLDQKVEESMQADSSYDSEARVTDGGIDERTQTPSSSSSSVSDSATDEALASGEEDTNSDDDDEPIIGSKSFGGEHHLQHPGRVKMLSEEVSPAFNRADTLILIIDLKKHLAGESVGADALYNIFDKTDKDAIVLATKADLLAEKFADERGWKTAWTDEAYDEFRTYVESELSGHNVLRRLLNRVDRPYPVGYQTVKPNPDSEEDDLEREIDRRTGLGKKRIQVHGYEYVLDRLN